MKSACSGRVWILLTLFLITSFAWGQQPPMASAEGEGASGEMTREIVDVRELFPEDLQSLDNEIFVRVQLVTYDDGTREVFMTSESESKQAPRRVSVGVNLREGTFKSTVQELPTPGPTIQPRFSGTRCFLEWVESIVYDGPLMSLVLSQVEWTYEPSTRCLLRDNFGGNCVPGNGVNRDSCVTGVSQNGQTSIHVSTSGRFSKPGLTIFHQASINSGPFVPTVAVSTSGVISGNRDFLLMEHYINSIPTC